MKVFYARTSTEIQNEERQLAMAAELGIEKIYLDKASGKDMNRPQLLEMINWVREGDAVVTESISRIARNIRDLLSIVDDLKKKGVSFVSLKEQIDTSTPQGKFVLTLFGALSELEREQTLQRINEGVAIAKAKGVYKGRKPMEIDKEKFEVLCREWRANKRTATSVMRDFKITATTFYRWVKEMGI